MMASGLSLPYLENLSAGAAFGAVSVCKIRQILFCETFALT